ncbi:MAG: hypothetical protein AB8B59_06765 [Maribacter sp.]
MKKKILQFINDNPNCSSSDIHNEFTKGRTGLITNALIDLVMEEKVTNSYGRGILKWKIILP